MNNIYYFYFLRYKSGYKSNIYTTYYTDSVLCYYYVVDLTLDILHVILESTLLSPAPPPPLPTTQCRIFTITTHCVDLSECKSKSIMYYSCFYSIETIQRYKTIVKATSEREYYSY